MALNGMFRHPTSVLLWGSGRSLLNWVAYALASAENPEFFWTDARLIGQALAPDDPLARHVVPPERLHVVEPDEVRSNGTVSKTALGTVVRVDEPAEYVRQLVDFLRLPGRLQEVLSLPRPGARLTTLVLSNGHRLASHFTTERVDAFLRAVVGTGSVFIMTFADSPGEGEHGFETTLHLEGGTPREWRQATLRAQKAPSHGPFRAGSVYRLEELEPVAAVLARDLG